MTKSIQNHENKTISNNKPNLKLIPSYTLHEEDAALCEQYHIPYQKSYSTQKELTEIEELIGDYLNLLQDAKSLGIYWNTTTFDPEGLRKAIEDYHIREGEEELAAHYHKEMKSNLWAYYSSLGVL